jgi:hypothetical protein
VNRRYKPRRAHQFVVMCSWNRPCVDLMVDQTVSADGLLYGRTGRIKFSSTDTTETKKMLKSKVCGGLL